MKFFKASLVAFAVAAIAATTAWAGEVPTTVKITDQVDVAGKVKSADSFCTNGRKVVLMEKRSGKDDKHGTDDADAQGRFSFGNPGLDPGKYYVRAKRILGACAPGKSDVFRVSSGG
jgi:hypothetical protein